MAEEVLRVDLRELKHDMANAVSIAYGLVRSVIRQLSTPGGDQALALSRLNSALESIERMEGLLAKLETENRSESMSK